MQWKRFCRAFIYCIHGRCREHTLALAHRRIGEKSQKFPISFAKQCYKHQHTHINLFYFPKMLTFLETGVTCPLQNTALLKRSFKQKSCQNVQKQPPKSACLRENFTCKLQMGTRAPYLLVYALDFSAFQQACNQFPTKLLAPMKYSKKHRIYNIFCDNTLQCLKSKR